MDILQRNYSSLLVFDIFTRQPVPGIQWEYFEINWWASVFEGGGLGKIKLGKRELFSDALIYTNTSYYI
jgi:hypothetical protein